jgi:hypothetical protein
LFVLLKKEREGEREEEEGEKGRRGEEETWRWGEEENWRWGEGIGIGFNCLHGQI